MSKFENKIEELIDSQQKQVVEIINSSKDFCDSHGDSLLGALINRGDLAKIKIEMLSLDHENTVTVESLLQILDEEIYGENSNFLGAPSSPNIIGKDLAAKRIFDLIKSKQIQF